MTEDELRFMRLDMRVKALKILLQALVQGVVPRDSLLEWKGKVAETLKSKSSSSTDPARRMIETAEFQDAVNDLLDDL